MPTKERTSVVRPGSIADVVNTVQKGVKTDAAEVSPQPKQVTAPTESNNQATNREYQALKNAGVDSWNTFIELARDYKKRDGRLATVYIDSDLKKVLDRLKSASNVKLPATAILSSIVARFLFEHEDEIKKLIYSQDIF